MPFNLPYPLFGLVYDTSSALIGSGTLVKARNNRTNELIQDYTNSSSEYVLDAANFSSGYDQNDTVTIYVFSKNAYAEQTVTLSSNLHNFNLTLETVSDSTLIYYTTVQYVWDELDGIGSSDVSAIRIVRSIQRAESEIENKAGRNFRSTTVTQEVYDFNQYNTWLSPEQLEFLGNHDGRNDYIFAHNRDRVQLRNRPIISITTLQRNTAGAASTDSWETLTENTGSSGDYVLTEEGKNTGFVDFVNKKPRYGKRAMRVTYVHGYSTTPKNVERLATLLAVRDVVLSKMSRSFFDAPHGISLRGIALDRNAAFAMYLKQINDEIDRLWVSVGTETRIV